MTNELRFEQLRACLRSYISPIMVETVLKSAMRRMGITPETIADARLDELVSHAMISLRLFVDPGRLPMLMVDLAALVDEDELPAGTHSNRLV